MRRFLWRADLALFGVTLIWGSTFVLVKNALEDVTPVLLLALRFSLATLALLLLFRRRIAIRSALLPGLIAGSLLYFAYLFQTTGLRLTTPAKSAFLTSLSVPMVPLFASIVYRSRPRPAEAGGAILATLGLALLTLRPGMLEIQRGDALTVFCAIGFAAHILTVGHFSVRAGFEGMAITQIATAAVLSLGSFWWVETPAVRWTFGLYVAILVTGVFATALAFTTQAWAQQYTTATRAAIIFAVEPVVAWGTSYLVTGETLSLRGVTGAGLIMAGILLAELKPPQTARHPPD